METDLLAKAADGAGGGVLPEPPRGLPYEEESAEREDILGELLSVRINYY